MDLNQRSSQYVPMIGFGGCGNLAKNHMTSYRFLHLKICTFILHNSEYIYFLVSFTCMKWYIFCQTAAPFIPCDDLPMMSCEFMLDCHTHQTLSLGHTVKTYLYDLFIISMLHIPGCRLKF
jgi:hypothetical protein